MPWHWEPKKDATSCEKPRGGANARRSAGVRMGKPAHRNGWASRAEVKIGARKATGGTEPSKYPQEEKETSISQVAASEREGAQTGGACRRGCGSPGGAREL